MSPLRRENPPAEQTGEPKKARPKLELPGRVRRPAAPPDAEPTPPPDAEPAAPPPAEEAPTPETVSRCPQFDDAVNHIITTGQTTFASLRDKFPGLNRFDLDRLLFELERDGIIGPRQVGKSRVILVTKWPLEAAAPAEPATEPEPIPTEPPPAEPKPTPAEPPSKEPPPEPPHAEPAPTEPAPAGEPAPGAEPATESPAASPEAPPTPPAAETRDRWESITASFRSAYDRFMSKFRGEVQPQDEKEYKASWGDVAKNAATGFLSVAASYTGVKILADLPQWIYQKYWTIPAERQRIKDVLAAKETELGERTEPTAIDQKKAKLEEAINASKFLTKEKKAELLSRLHATVNEYETKDKALRTERNEKIAKLLDQAIETRVKNTQILKEGLNSALMVTGLAAMRGVAYGAVASYERYKRVAKERAEGKREGGQFKEWIVKGFTETAHNLIGGKADTWAGKGANFVKGATNVLRAAGFADLAIAEWTGEGRSVGSIIETSLKAWEDKGTAAGWDNIKAPWERLVGLGSAAEKAGATGPDAGAAAAESAPSVEIPEAQIEAGLVKKGDGIIKILERQGIETKAALDAAREAGIVRAGGDTRLTTEAIGRLSVFAQTQPDGDIEIKFFDSETDKLLTLEEARETGFTYESGTVPGEIPTDKEIVEHILEPTPDVDVLVDSPAPNDLLGGTFHLYTDAEKHFTSLDPGDGDMLTRMNDATQELARSGHGESPEAKFIFERYTTLLKNEDVEPAAGLPPSEAAQQAVEEVRAHEAVEAEAAADSEQLRKFNGEAGRVKFVYDKETGEVKDTFMPAYTPRPRDIENSLKEWGLTNKEVKAHFFEGASRTHMDGTTIDTSHPGRYPGVERTGFPIQSPENDYRQFVRDAERMSRQEALLNEMAENGYARTPEYLRLKMETEQLEKFVAGEMKKEFNIKERGI